MAVALLPRPVLRLGPHRRPRRGRRCHRPHPALARAREGHGGAGLHERGRLCSDDRPLALGRSQLHLLQLRRELHALGRQRGCPCCMAAALRDPLVLAEARGGTAVHPCDSGPHCVPHHPGGQHHAPHQHLDNEGRLLSICHSSAASGG